MVVEHIIYEEFATGVVGRERSCADVSFSDLDICKDGYHLAVRQDAIGAFDARDDQRQATQEEELTECHDRMN